LAENRDLDGLTIFLVEDNAMNQQIAQELLESAGITVKIANNGLEVVEALMAEPEIVSCDAILMDIQMPEMDGYEAARRIRKMPRHAVTPIIAMTAHAMAEDRNEAAAAGMNDHIAKPITPKDLFQTIRRWTKSVSPEKIGLPGLGKDLPAGFPAIPGVDVQEGLGRLVGNAQTYLGLLKKFPMTQEGELRKIGQAIADKDLEQTQALIHRLKGLAGNLSLTDLFQAAAALEKALHVPDWAESTRRFEILETEFHQFSQAIEAFSPAELCGESLEKLASGPSLKMMTLPLAEVLIEELKTLLLANNSQATQSLKSMVAGFECPAACATDFVALESAIDRFDFDQALRILAAIEIKLDNTRKKTDET
jgi:CheY-like chemotaxis protein